jgi:hypothetical protein
MALYLTTKPFLFDAYYPSKYLERGFIDTTNLTGHKYAKI